MFSRILSLAGLVAGCSGSSHRPASSAGAEPADSSPPSETLDGITQPLFGGERIPGIWLGTQSFQLELVVQPA